MYDLSQNLSKRPLQTGRSGQLPTIRRGSILWCAEAQRWMTRKELLSDSVRCFRRLFSQPAGQRNAGPMCRHSDHIGLGVQPATARVTSAHIHVGAHVTDLLLVLFLLLRTPYPKLGLKGQDDFVSIGPKCFY